MSYTAPQYVDTKEQAILALASTIKGEAVTGGDGSVNRALDILADVLAEQDVQVPQTDAGAILALAQYASGMVKPEGTITITENGTGIDVAQYATADVSVSGGGIEWQQTSVQNYMVYMDRYDDGLDGWRVGVYAPNTFSGVQGGNIIGVRFDNVLYPIAAGKIGSDFFGSVKTAISGESYELNLYFDHDVFSGDFIILIKQGTATKEQLQSWAAGDHFLSIDYTSIA